MQTWLLPEHIEDILPPEARRIEGLRRQTVAFDEIPVQITFWYRHGSLLE